MDSDAWLTVGVIFTSFFVLLLTSIGADIVLMSAAVMLMMVGILSPGELLSGFANLGLATVAVMFIVASALTRTGSLSALSDSLLGNPDRRSVAQLRLMLPVAAISSVLNNTPVVAMMIPLVQSWAKRLRMSPSQLMIPLSYAAIVGGVCTLIGTSTNLVINDMLIEHGIAGLGLFELAWVGVPLVIITVLSVVVMSKWLLPKGMNFQESSTEDKQYTMEMVVGIGSSIVGKSVEKAGLRNLTGVYLIEIIRDNRVFTAVSPSEVLYGGDRLIFAGDVDSVVDLQNMRGLEHAEDHVFKIDADRSQRNFVEVILGKSFPYLGQTVRESEFRKKYGAAIIAISREGEHVKQRIGDIELRKGDLLLLEAPSEFTQNRRYEKDFLLLSEVHGSAPTLHSRRYWAIAILAMQIALVTTGVLSLFEAACVSVVLLLATRCISVDETRHSIDWQILIVIAASIALGRAAEKTGVAEVFALATTSLVADSAYLSLAAIFLVTAVLTALISNIAAAVVLFPVAQSIAEQLGVSVLPFVVTLMIAASVSFATPIGYQTNLMVYGPGNYRYMDFIKIGVPLTLILGLFTLVLVPIIWPFS